MMLSTLMRRNSNSNDMIYGDRSEIMVIQLSTILTIYCALWVYESPLMCVIYYNLLNLLLLPIQFNYYHRGAPRLLDIIKRKPNISIKMKIIIGNAFGWMFAIIIMIGFSAVRAYSLQTAIATQQGQLAALFSVETIYLPLNIGIVEAIALLLLLAIVTPILEEVQMSLLLSSFTYSVRSYMYLSMNYAMVSMFYLTYFVSFTEAILVSAVYFFLNFAIIQINLSFGMITSAFCRVAWSFAVTHCTLLILAEKMNKIINF